jgi:hypothetical protein
MDPLVDLRFGLGGGTEELGVSVAGDCERFVSGCVFFL